MSAWTFIWCESARILVYKFPLNWGFPNVVSPTKFDDLSQTESSTWFLSRTWRSFSCFVWVGGNYMSRQPLPCDVIQLDLALFCIFMAYYKKRGQKLQGKSLEPNDARLCVNLRDMIQPTSRLPSLYRPGSQGCLDIPAGSGQRCQSRLNHWPTKAVTTLPKIIVILEMISHGLRLQFDPYEIIPQCVVLCRRKW